MMQSAFQNSRRAACGRGDYPPGRRPPRLERFPGRAGEAPPKRRVGGLGRWDCCSVIRRSAGSCFASLAVLHLSFSGAAGRASLADARSRYNFAPGSWRSAPHGNGTPAPPRPAENSHGIAPMSEGQAPGDVALGVPEMDREHRVQVRLVQAVRDAFVRSERKRALELVDELDDYTNMHFMLEETLMIGRGYPGRQSHQQEHDRLIEELRALRSAVAAGEAQRLSAVGAIEEWLLRHIRTFDRAFAAYLAARNGGRGPHAAPARW